MNPERWRQIDEVFQVALEQAPEDRAAFIGKTCGDDDSLRREVEALLVADGEAGSLIEAPAYAIGAALIVDGNAKSLIGQNIIHYQIISLLGQGGMGEVYQARDTKLDRVVALKILPAEFAADKERMRRFVREAKAASALNHPNVAHIYEIGEENGLSFIAMEHVEGQTLAARIDGHPLPVSEIVEIGSQIADALGEAHSRGITHRDIKPANVMLNERGQVKVLDFGLAKITHPATPSGSDISTLLKTKSGVVMGTVPYMSPEQALGHDVDHRSDIFSLGIVLYEMATGCLPFVGANTIETLDRLLHLEPEAISRFNDKIPAQLESFVGKCLEKNREQRYQSAQDLLADIASLKRDLETGSVSPMLRPAVKTELASGKRQLSLTRRWALATLCLLLIVASLFGLYRLLNKSRPLSSIAVLPLKNLSGNPELEWFSDGITQQLISEFQRFKAIKVIASTSVMQLKDTKKSLSEIANDLGVQAILEGSALRVGDNVQIKSRLIDTATSRVLWSKDYDREYKDVLALYREVARTVASEIQVTLSPAEQASLSKFRTVIPAAQDALYKGRVSLNQVWQNPVSLKKALESYEEAVRLDPRDAEAWAGLSESYTLLSNWGLMPQEVAMPKARDAARQALELDQGSATAHRAEYAWHFTWQHDWPLVEREIKRTLELAPNDTRALSYYSEYLIAMGRNDEAIAQAQRAHELAPLDLGLYVPLGRIYYFVRRYDEAIRIFKAILDLDEKWLTAAAYLSHAYLALKKDEEAWLWQLKIINADPGHTEEDRQRLREARRTGGWPAVWREDLAWFNRAKFPPAAVAGRKAWLHAQLNEKDQAFTELEVAFRGHSPWLFQLNDPLFDPIRSDPRFKELLLRLNLPSV